MEDLMFNFKAYTYTAALILLIIAGIVFVIKNLLNYKYKCIKSGLKIGRKSDVCGVVLGKLIRDYVVYSPLYREDHVAIYGGSGSGKSSAVIIPTLRSIARRIDAGTFFAIDISGDLSANVHGMNTIIYNPTDQNSSISFDVFSTIRTLQNSGLKYEANDALVDICYEIIPDKASDDNAKWFADSGRDILKAAFIAFQEMEFVDICEKIVNSDYATLFYEIDNAGDDAKRYINQFVGMSEKNISGAYQVASQAVSLFASPIIAKSLRPNRTTLTPESLESKSIFFQISERELEKYAPLLELITGRILFYLARRPYTSKKIMIVLDEYASLRNLDISGPLARLRKRGVRIMIALQSIAQLDGNFTPATRKSIMDNCGINIVLGVSDPELQDYFSKKAGAVVDVRTNTNGYHDKSYSEYDRPLIEPIKFGKLKKTLYVLSHGETIELRKNYYFK